MRCPLTEAGLKPLPVVARVANFHFQHQLCRLNICKTSKRTVGAAAGRVHGGWAGPESELPLPQWVQVHNYYSPRT